MPWYKVIELFDTIITGTMRRQESDAFRLFIVMLSQCDRDGIVRCAKDTLEFFCNINRPRLDEALAALEAPDEESTSEEEDGRRIITLGPNVWRVVNYAKYQELLKRERAKAADARAAQRRRAQQKDEGKAEGEAPPKKSHHKKKPEGEVAQDKYAKGEVPRQQCPLNDEQMALLMGVKQTLQPGSKPGTAEYDAWLRLVELHPIDRIQTVSRFISNDVQPPADNGWTGWKAVCKSVTSMEKNWDMIYAAMIAEDPGAEGPEGAERKLRETARIYAEQMPEDYPTADDAYRELKADRERDFAMGKI